MNLRRLSLLLLAIYALLTLYLIVRGLLRLPVQPFLTPIATAFGFAFAVVHAGERLGWGRAALLLGLTFFVSLLFESVGVSTGIVYGPYHYTDRLGAKFLGLVPYLIPLAWFMMMYPSYLIAARLLPRTLIGWRRVLALAGLAGIVMTAWDLVIDPLMVAAGHWVWEVPGVYFGIPIHNYWGWWLTTFTTYLVFLLLTRQTSETSSDFGGSEAGFDRLAVLSYLVTAAGSMILAVTYGLGGPVLVGLFAMGPWILLAWWRTTPEPGAARLKTTWF